MHKFFILIHLLYFYTYKEIVHQVGKKDYHIRMHGQQNTKNTKICIILPNLTRSEILRLSARTTHHTYASSGYWSLGQSVLMRHTFCQRVQIS
jgi:hypothetical protein